MPKNILIPQDIATKIYAVVLLMEGYNLPENILVNIREITDYFEEKANAQSRRQAYTNYKIAPIGSGQREAARQNYLDQARIHPDWRSTTETSTP